MNRLLHLSVQLACCGTGWLAAAEPAAGQTAPPAEVWPTPSLEERRQERRQFQDQELTTARPLTRVFTPGEPPRIVWRDVDEVRRLGGAGKPRVRWFDADLNEVAVPNHPGRWAAWVEDRAPNGTPVRRLLAFYARPKDFLAYLPPSLPVAPLPGPIPPEIWTQRREEIERFFGRLLLSMNDTEAGAILLAGLTEPQAAASPDLTAQASHEEFQFRLKMKVQGLSGLARDLPPPRTAPRPAPVLRAGSPREARVATDAKERLDRVLEAWAADTNEPLVTLVARHGVIITHLAAGRDPQGHPIDLDYQAGVASITKTATALLFSRFLEAGFVQLDDSIGRVFPDYPADRTRVPSFRECLTHMSGFSGHGDWGGARNAHLDNLLLNGIDANRPGTAYTYSGTGFEAVALAMQVLSGRSFTQLYRQHLLEPLGMDHARIEDASAGAHFCALDLAKIAQWLVNRGSYGDHQFVSEQTFQQLLPEDLSHRYPGVTREVEGIGMHWMYDRKPGANAGSKAPEDLILSPQTLGHGSLSSCILRADLDNALVVVQIRRQAGPRFAEWQTRFLQTVAAVLHPKDVAALPTRTRP
jgi:CubicO group peptidase (beta-lactamase class C family)